MNPSETTHQQQDGKFLPIFISLVVGMFAGAGCCGVIVALFIFTYDPLVDLTYPVVGEVSGILPFMLAPVCALPAALGCGAIMMVLTYKWLLRQRAAPKIRDL